MTMFFRRSSTIGLDIGDLSVKVVTLRKHGAAFVLDRSAETALPAQTVVSGAVTNAPALAQTIKQALKTHRVRANGAVAALPEAKTFMKLIRVDAEPSLEQAVHLELPKHIPYSEEEVVTDFTLVEREHGNAFVLVGVCSRQLAQQYVQVLSETGLLPEALDLESLAVTRALIRFGTARDHGTLIVDLGGSKSTILVAAGEVPILSMDARAAGNPLTEQLAGELHIDLPAAEEMKRRYGFKSGGSSAYGAVLERYGKRLTGRIKEALGAAGHAPWQSAPAISEILLSGGASALPGLPQYLMNALRLKVKLGNPFTNLAAASPAMPETAAIRFTTAIGLALYKTANSHD